MIPLIIYMTNSNSQFTFQMTRFVLELTFKHFWHLLSQNIGYNLVNTSLPHPGTKLPGLGHVPVVKIPVSFQFVDKAHSSYTRSNELPINKMSLIDKTCQLLAHWMSQLLKICPVLVIEFYSQKVEQQSHPPIWRHDIDLLRDVPSEILLKQTGIFYMGI